MKRHEPTDRRRVLTLLAWGGLLAVAPIDLGGPQILAQPLVWADDHGNGNGNSGRGNSGNGNGNSGSGNGGGRNDDNRGNGNGKGNSGRGNDRDEEVQEDSGGSGGGRVRDITVQYSDGWLERIVGGQYELIDQQSRLVVSRPATAEDFARMDALR